MTQLDYYSHLLCSLVTPAEFAGVVISLLAVTYIIHALFTHAGPRK